MLIIEILISYALVTGFCMVYLFWCRSYSYYIEVSMDELDWVRVVDHSKYLCRSWQNLFFTPRVAR
jgi:hypothetical protein